MKEIITKKQFIGELAAKTGLTKKDITKVINAMPSVLFAHAREQDTVKLMDGMTVSGYLRPERNGVNPATGESLVIPPKVIPKAKFGIHTKEIVEGKVEI